jgi:class 3 adenylate cyclase
MGAEMTETDTGSSALERARAALARHEWRAALDDLTAADANGELDASGLELLAEAAWWSGQLPAAIEARERAYASATRAGNVEEAVIAAINLGRDNVFRLALPVAAGWLKRAERQLEGVEENPGHGWLAAAWGLYAAIAGTGDLLAYATKANEIGKRFGVRDLEVIGLGQKAVALIRDGHVEEGLALADEATVAAVSGEIEPGTAGGVCCATIEACTGIGDLRRAAEWTEAQDRWCKREGINGYPGMCRLFRSDIKRLRGDWPEAEAEALLASEELKGFIPAAGGLALYEIGLIRLRRGDLPAAEEALLGAHALGHDPEPALSLLRLAQGKVEAAASSIRQALDEPGTMPSWRPDAGSHVGRLTFLPVQVEIALAAGDLATARTATDELSTLAEKFGTPSARGVAASCLGAVLLAEGDPAGAAQQLRAAVQHWTELEAPYELARTRMTLAEAYAAQEMADRAIVEARAARGGFERLGARLDIEHADALLTSLGVSADDGAVGTATTRTERTLVFTDIVDSTRLAESLGDDAWDRVLRRHHQLVRAAVAEQGGEEVKATGDGFFLAFADPDPAIEAAVAIQRRLAAQREEAGFAPDVRIGIHAASVNRIGLDYQGGGVNQASRIADAAAGGEILVSAATLERARHRFAVSGRRTVELKGISAPVDTVAIGWG